MKPIALACFAALTLLSTVALAKPCAPEGPWVLAIVSSPPPRGFKIGDVLDRLAVELSARGMTLCDAAPPPARQAPVATVTLAQPSPRVVALEVDVRDGTRKKHEKREIDLVQAPPERSATVVALAADELLRAAAEELALEVGQSSAPPPTTSPTEAGGSQARSDGADTTGHPRARTLALGLRGAGELWTGGLSLLGADALGSLAVAPRTRLELYVGARKAFDRDATHGAVEAWAPCGRLGGSVSLTRPSSSPELAIAGRLGVYAVSVSGQPTAGSRGGADTSAALTIEAGPSLRVLLPEGQSALVLDAMLGAALRGVSARDGDEVVTGLTGVALTASLGFVTGVL